MSEESERPTSRNIPDPIQREVRQRCGFGCVICGRPLYQYDHLLGWANVQRHVANEITLLCDDHHREKTGGLLPGNVVVTANNDPYNLRYGVSKPYNLYYSGDECEIGIGGNTFRAKDAGYGTILVPVLIDGLPNLAFVLGDGHLLLNLCLFDEHNQLVLQIHNNQLIYSVTPWDIELVGTNLIVRVAARRILVDITFDPPNRIIINRGRFLRNGVEILIRPDHVIVANNGMMMTGTTMDNVRCGIAIGPHEEPIRAVIRMAQVSRYVHGKRESDEWIANAFASE